LRRIKLVLAVVAAMVAMMAFAGPVLASTFGSCINVPLSSLTPLGGPTTYIASLLQLALVVGIVVVAVVVLMPTPSVRPIAPADNAQVVS
jgi:hypothetical protein